jgi:hypothetical protein
MRGPDLGAGPRRGGQTKGVRSGRRVGSYCSRWWEKPSAARLPFGSSPTPNQVTPKPGQMSTTVASRHRNVGRIEQIHDPAMQNGTR